MPEFLSGIAGEQSLAALIFAIFVAGTLRGFTGFGTALVFMPVAARFVSPVEAIVLLTIADVAGPLPIVPQAWRDASKPELARLVIGCLIGIPLGLWVLLSVEPENFRWTVSSFAILTLLALISGWRYHGAINRWITGMVGAVGGFLGGFLGIPGPPVIFYHLAQPLAAARIRANNTLFLLAFDFMIIGMLAFSGEMQLRMVLLGAVLILPNMAGNVLGARLFAVHGAAHFRWVAYVAMFLAAASGLPLLDGLLS